MYLISLVFWFYSDRAEQVIEISGDKNESLFVVDFVWIKR